MALDNDNGQFPDGGIFTIGTSAGAVAIPKGATLAYAQTVHATAAVTYDPTGSGNVKLSISSSSGTLIWAGPSFGGNRSVELLSDTASTPVHVVLFSDQP